MVLEGTLAKPTNMVHASSASQCRACIGVASGFDEVHSAVNSALKVGGVEAQSPGRSWQTSKSGARHLSGCTKVGHLCCDAVSPRAAMPDRQDPDRKNGSQSQHPCRFQNINVPCSQANGPRKAKPALSSSGSPPPTRAMRASKVQASNACKSAGLADAKPMGCDSDSGACPDTAVFGAVAQDDMVAKTKPLHSRRPRSILLPADEGKDAEPCSTAKEDTPQAITDAALRRSQLILEQFETLGLLDDLESDEIPEKAVAADKDDALRTDSDQSTVASADDIEAASEPEASTAEGEEKVDLLTMPSEVMDILRGISAVALQGRTCRPDEKEILVEKRFGAWQPSNLGCVSPRQSVMSPGSAAATLCMSPRDSLITPGSAVAQLSTSPVPSCIGTDSPLAHMSASPRDALITPRSPAATIESKSSSTSHSRSTRSHSSLSQDDLDLLKELRDLLRSQPPAQLPTSPVQRTSVQKQVCAPLMQSMPVPVLKTILPVQLQRWPPVPVVAAVPATPATIQLLH